MLQPDTTHNLKGILAKITGATVHSVEQYPVGGGSINDTYRLVVNKTHSFFLKVNKAASFPGLFEKEKAGLEYIANQHRIAVPTVISCDIDKDNQLLLLEWIPAGSRTGSFWKTFGEQLAGLHQCHNDQHGFVTGNYMGALPQSNHFDPDWAHFFLHQRLLPQVKMATEKKLMPHPYADLFHQLGKKLGNIFNTEPPSLLHGDLWSGNFMCNDQSLPVLIDPAVYYGHRSMDLAMTTLFGGFDQAFYESYHYHFPLPANHQEQWEICNLYPLLIHLNLFGQSYLSNIVSILKSY